MALKGILMSLYAWNSAPVIGTSRSLLVTGREFIFPIDFSSEQHQILTSSPLEVSSFVTKQARLLKCGRDIARKFIHHYRAWHRECVNERHSDPRQYSVGNRVFAKQTVHSNKKRGLVGKLMDAYTGPWEILGKLRESSYDIKKVPTRKLDKRHAAHLLPYPDTLMPFLPVDEPNNQFGQLNTPIFKDPYFNAGLKCFEPPQPYKATALSAFASDEDSIIFPSLAQLNFEIFD